MSESIAPDPSGYLVILETFPNHEDAAMAQGFLEENGIESHILETADPFPAIGGVHVLVFRKDFDEARRIWDESETAAPAE